MTNSAAPTPSQWYRLTNTFTGPNLSLDVVNDNGLNSSGQLQMATSGDYSGQYWQLSPNPNPSSSTNALFTLFLGANKRLDVFSANNTPHLADAGNSPGQIWTITAWGDGTWQLSNQETGNGLYLDVYSDTHAPFLDGGDHTGQHWIFTPLQTTTSPSQNNSTPLPNPSLPLQSSPPHK